MVQIDPEFKSLIPKLSTEEYELLEASIQAEGCRDALVLWGDVLIDGHNRYEICQRLGVGFQTTAREFDSREDVIIWMVNNQLARRNITSFVRGELALRMKDAIATKAKANQQSTQFGNTVLQNFAEPIDTRAEIAKIADVSHETIRKVEKVADAAPEPIKEAARKGDISVDRAYRLTKALEALPVEYHEAAIKLAVDSDEKINILSRLHKSAGSLETNGTFDEIMSTGGFQHGKDMEKWLNYTTSTIEDIRKGLDSIRIWHIEQAKDRKRLEKIEATQRALAELKDPSNYGVVVGDMRRLFDDLDDESVDLFFTDPPYHEEHISLYGELARLAAVKLKPGGLCLAYGGQTFLPRVMEQMSQYLAYWWMFAISHTGGNLAIWQRQLQNEWKPVFVFAKPLPNGKLPLAPEYTVDFVPGGGRDKRYHEWGQDAGEITYWIEKLTNPGDLVCDPFIGGGSVPVACKLVGRRWIGTEIDEPMAMQARLRISKVNGGGVEHDQAA